MTVTSTQVLHEPHDEHLLFFKTSEQNLT